MKFVADDRTQKTRKVEIMRDHSKESPMQKRHARDRKIERGRRRGKDEGREKREKERERERKR